MTSLTSVMTAVLGLRLLCRRGRRLCPGLYFLSLRSLSSLSPIRSYTWSRGWDILSRGNKKCVTSLQLTTLPSPWSMELLPSINFWQNWTLSWARGDNLDIRLRLKKGVDKMNQDSINVLTTYYASLNPCVSFANSGCAPGTVNYVIMIKIKMIKSCDEHLSLIPWQPSLHENWWHLVVWMVNWVFHYPQLPEHFINKSGASYFREKIIKCVLSLESGIVVYMYFVKHALGHLKQKWVKKQSRSWTNKQFLCDDLTMSVRSPTSF